MFSLFLLSPDFLFSFFFLILFTLSSVSLCSIFFLSFSLVLSISSSLQPSRPCPLLLVPHSLTGFPWVWVTVLRRSLWVTWSRWVWVIGHSLVVDQIWWWVKFCDGWILRLWWWLFCDLVAGFFFCDWCFVMDGFWQLFCNLWWLGFGNCFVIGCLMDRFCDLVVVL